MEKCIEFLKNKISQELSTNDQKNSGPEQSTQLRNIILVYGAFGGRMD